MNGTEFIGWASSLVLLLTIGRQVYTEWKTHTTAGVSRWLFAGQITASIGFCIYSWKLRNWVFVSSNVALLITAMIGQGLYWKNKGRNDPGRSGDTPATTQAEAERHREESIHALKLVG